MVEINWYNIGNDQNLHLSTSELKYIEDKIESKFGSLLKLGRKLNAGTSIYTKIKYKEQGITAKFLKEILDALKMPYNEIGKQPVKIGRYNYVCLKFPFDLDPKYGQILSHAFFDGYCDNYVLRYSNYSNDIREEFCLIVNSIINVKVHNPDNVKLYINLPVFVPRFLKNVFRVTDFHGSTCRIPSAFFGMVKKNPKFGWYFLKGAYIDEGTISGKQIWIARGIKNKVLAQNIVRLSRLLSLNTELKEVQKGYFGVKLAERDYLKFHSNIDELFIFKKVAKWQKLSDKIHKWLKYKEKEKKLIEDCKKIITCVKKTGQLTTKEISEICKIPPSTAFFRAHFLIFNGNLEKKRIGKKNIYLFNNEEISNIPNQNDMRRFFGWR